MSFHTPVEGHIEREREEIDIDQGKWRGISILPSRRRRRGNTLIQRDINGCLDTLLHDIHHWSRERNAGGWADLNRERERNRCIHIHLYLFSVHVKYLELFVR